MAEFEYYKAQKWINKNGDGTIPQGAIPVSAENLQKMDSGIEKTSKALGEYMGVADGKFLKIESGTVSGGTIEFVNGIPMVLIVQRDGKDYENAFVALNGVTKTGLFPTIASGSGSIKSVYLEWDSINQTVTINCPKVSLDGWKWVSIYV